MTDQRQMLGMNVDMKMSLGNMITIGILITTIVGGWFSFQKDMEQAKLDITKNTTRIERLETQNGDTKDRLTRMEVTLQNMAVQLDRAVRVLERRPADQN